MSRKVILPKLIFTKHSDIKENVSKLFDEYEPVLSKYYDINRYNNCKNIETKTISTARGADKYFELNIDENGHRYVSCGIKQAIFSNDIKNHLKMLSKYLPIADTLKFKIPLIYRNDIYYVMDYVDFDFESNKRYAKLPRLLKDYCIGYGQFINFMLKHCKMDPRDVESYIDKNGDLWFIDYGNFVDINDNYITKFRNELSYICEMRGELFDNCSEHLKCVMSMIEES